MIRPFGEAALLVELDSPQRAQTLAADLRAAPLAGIVEVVPGLASLLVELDPLATSPRAVERELERRLTRAAVHALPAGRARTIPAVYGGDHGRDLAEVAGLCGLSEAEVIERHTSIALRVLFDGFAPGFAYLGELPVELRVPRLATPRTRTPAGSVAVAESMSGVYPTELPGGWRVIGRTPVLLFDPKRETPAYLAPGDTVRFRAIEPGEWAAHQGPPADW